MKKTRPPKVLYLTHYAHADLSQVKWYIVSFVFTAKEEELNFELIVPMKKGLQ